MDGLTVRCIRLILNETYEEFANRLKVSVSLVEKVEAGTRNSNGLIKKRIITSCGFSIDELNEIRMMATRIKKMKE